MKIALILALSLLSPTVFAKDISMKISGMVCSMCAQGIQKKFTAIPDVKEVNVNLDSKIVSVITNGEADIADATLHELIKEAGYNVTSIERK